MARITKAVLEAQVATLAAQLAEAQAALLALQAECDAHEAARAATEADNEALRAQLHTHTTPSRRVVRHMPDWQVQRAEQMAAARALAMRVGRTVKVEVAA